MPAFCRSEMTGKTTKRVLHRTLEYDPGILSRICWPKEHFYINAGRLGLMDPMFRVREAFDRGIIPQDVFSLVEERFPIVLSGITRIEKASRINYPAAYIEPSAVLSEPDPSSFQYGILFARTIPLITDDKLQVVIQISAPLVAYGLKGTIHAILAHEFLHYLELVHRASKMSMVSDEVSGSVFENVYADGDRLFEPRSVFADKTLLSHITKRFPAGFRDYKLEDKTVKLWLDKKLPKINIALEDNIARVSAESLAKIKLHPSFLTRLAEIEQKSAKIRRRKNY